MADETPETARDLLGRLKREGADPEDVEVLFEFLEADDAGDQSLAINGLRTVAGRRPGLLADVGDDELETLTALFSHDDPTVRGGAVALLGSIWTPDLVPAADLVAEVRPLLTDDQALVQGSAVETLQTVATMAPDAVTDAIDDVVPLLELSGSYRTAAVSVVAAAAAADAASVRPHLERLLDVFESELDTEDATALREMSDQRVRNLQNTVRDIQGVSFQDHRAVRQMTGHAVVEVAAAEPESVLPYVDDVAAQLSDYDPQVRHVAADVLVAIGEDHSDVVADHAATLAGVLEPDEAEFVVESALKALASATATDEAAVAAAVRDHVDLVYAHLDAEEPTVRGAAATLLAVLAEEDPSVVDPVTDRLQELSRDEPEYVRAAATDALQSAE